MFQWPIQWYMVNLKMVNIKSLCILHFALCTILLASCSAPTQPKPYGYVYIDTPDTAYLPFSAYRTADSACPYAAYPYDFALSRNAEVVSCSQPGEHFWINIHYPSLNTDIHCSYKPVRGNLRELTDDAVKFVYDHAIQASAIPEQAYEHPGARVWGVLYNLEGNTASSSQFFLTDSLHHFFRASVYSYCPPNADSLAPVYEYMQQDILRMIESFQWR